MSGCSSRVLWREQRLPGDDRGERDLTHNLFIFSLMLKNLKGIESNQQRVEVFVVAFFASPNKAPTLEPHTLILHRLSQLQYKVISS